MLTAFLLGLTGSLGHCTGMCSGIVLLLSRSLGERPLAGMAWLHTGRILSYSLLGLLAGLAGQGLQQLFTHLELLQGALALYAALLGLYFVLALLGVAPGPEALFPGLPARWGRWFRGVSGRGPLFAGLAWGLLPCGLVLTALFTAAVSASPLDGALRMAVFGAATLPVLAASSWVARRPSLRTWPRWGAAAAVLLFSVQTGLRSLAAFGFVDHLMIGQVMLW